MDKLLDGDGDARLTVVSAGAGWGKTTAVATWAAARPGPVAWLSLEPRDTVPQALASRVLDALRTSGAVPGRPPARPAAGAADEHAGVRRALDARTRAAPAGGDPGRRRPRRGAAPHRGADGP
ncbi:hypothetical protein [Cellulomonas sp. Y8]|uniref:hypothetical protein n=1 Tax=Cellulomonas sp. Y8 TaxID=2591145 RepID=UPI0011CCA431|nr:hypothetical protein [Cellulomonas sp. Y8]